MNSWNRAALAVSALLVMSAPILAQTTPVATPGAAAAPRGGQGRRGGMAGLPVSAIDTLVKLTEDQKTKITAVQAKLKTDVEASAGDRAKTRELMTGANEDIKAVLTPDQQKTLAEKLPVVMLLNQSKAVPAGALGDVKLTSDQMVKIKTAAMVTQEKMKAVAKEDRKTKNPEILADFKTQVDTILTADQKETVSKFHTPRAGKKKANP